MFHQSHPSSRPTVEWFDWLLTYDGSLAPEDGAQRGRARVVIPASSAWCLHRSRLLILPEQARVTVDSEQHKVSKVLLEARVMTPVCFRRCYGSVV